MLFIAATPALQPSDIYQLEPPAALRTGQATGSSKVSVRGRIEFSNGQVQDEDAADLDEKPNPAPRAAMRLSVSLVLLEAFQAGCILALPYRCAICSFHDPTLTHSPSLSLLFAVCMLLLQPLNHQSTNLQQHTGLAPYTNPIVYFPTRVSGSEQPLNGEGQAEQ